MKIIILISFVALSSLVLSSMNTYQNYNMKKNSSPINGLPYLVDSFPKQAFFFCLAACNSNLNCLTIVFQMNSVNSNQGVCKLYSKKFQDTDLISSMGSDLYEKNNFFSVTSSTSQKSSTDSLTTTSITKTLSVPATTTITREVYNITDLNDRLLNGKFRPSLD